MRLNVLPPIVLAVAMLAWAPAATAADAGRGRMLYESGCDGCHAESVHGRARRAAADFEAVRGWVRRWNAHLGLKWADDEVDDVTVYLNARYYGFRCPAAVCPATGLADAPRRVALDGRHPLTVP
jgi:hypothetical protein